MQWFPEFPCVRLRPKSYEEAEMIRPIFSLTLAFTIACSAIVAMSQPSMAQFCRRAIKSDWVCSNTEASAKKKAIYAWSKVALRLYGPRYDSWKYARDHWLYCKKYSSTRFCCVARARPCRER